MTQHLDSQKQKKSSARRRFFLQLADSVICLFIMFPVLVCYWRGIQDILTVFVFPSHRVLNILSVTAVGLLTPAGYLVAPVLDRWMEGRHDTWLHWFVTKVFMLTYGELFMCMWYGLWNTAGKSNNDNTMTYVRQCQKMYNSSIMVLRFV